MADESQSAQSWARAILAQRDASPASAPGSAAAVDADGAATPASQPKGADLAAAAPSTWALPLPPTEEAAEAHATDLIDLYFAAETPAERDLTFEQLAALQTATVEQFLRAMLVEDEDPYMRLAAAHTLLQWQRAEVSLLADSAALAEATLDACLRHPNALGLLELAIDAAIELFGEAAYARLQTLWAQRGGDAAGRCALMLGMERADASRALAAFAAFVEGLTALGSLPEPELEAAMVSFGRHAYRPAKATLERLRTRLLDDRDLAPQRRRGLVAFVDEGLALFEPEAP